MGVPSANWTRETWSLGVDCLSVWPDASAATGNEIREADRSKEDRGCGCATRGTSTVPVRMRGTMVWL